MITNHERGMIFGGVPSIIRDRKVFIPYVSTDDEVAIRAWPDQACETEHAACDTAQRLYEERGFTR